ncbi:MAG: HYR domain-containing protein [Saprospiraceae bacterium]
MRKLLFLVFLLSSSLLATVSSAQGLFSCTSGGSIPPPGALVCANTCIYCNIDGLQDQNNVFLPGTLNFTCLGTITLENPRWYGFIAGSPNITFLVTYLSCSGNNGLQGAIVDNCMTTIACNPVGTSSAPNSMELEVTGLTVGKAYQLMIDGINGEVCQYKISVTHGVASPQPLGALGAIQGQQQLCPNATVEYSIAPVDNAAVYTWTAPPGASINGGGNVATVPGPFTGASVTIKFGNTGGNVCVSASNICSPAVSTCLPVSVTPLPITILSDITVCNEWTPFEWDEEPHTQLFNPGTYTLTSTPYQSYLGCDSIVRQKVTILPLNFTNLGVKYICEGECFYVGPYEYCNPGTYTDVISAENGCDSIVKFTLVKIPVKAVIQQPDTITCAVPSVPLSGQGSTTGSSVFYTWLNSSGVVISNTINATATAPGQYSLIVRNSAGGVLCYDTATVFVPGETTVPLADAGPNLTLTCSVTQLQLQGNGSMGAQYSYLWTASNGGNIVSGSTTLTPTVNATGTYKLRVTNNLNGCTAVSLTVINAQTQSPTVGVTGGTVSCATPNISLGSTTGAVNPTYAWTGPNSFTSSAPNPTVSTPGNYTLVVTDGNTGCTNSATAVVSGNSNPPGATATGGTLTCTVSSVQLQGTSGGSGVTWLWTGPNGFTSGAQNPTVSAEGAYQLLVTGTNGCTSTATANVGLDNTAPGASVAPSGNLNCNNASVTLVTTSTANPNDLQHLWTLPDNSTTNTGADAFLAVNQPGQYSVLVTNTENGCTSTATATVIQYAPVAANIDGVQNVTCFGSANGGLVGSGSGGNGNYSFNWSSGGSDPGVSGLAAGDYILTVTDSDGCSGTVQATISQPSQLSVNASATPQSSNGATDGTATANPSGGSPNYAYLWSNDETTASISGLLPGSYTVTVTDANLCTAVQTVNVNAYNCAIQTEYDVTNVSCFGANDGSANVFISGGQEPYEYLWSNDATTSSVTGLAPGQYTVTIMDAANCPSELTFTVFEPTQVNANATGEGTSGPNTNDGSATANPTGGFSPYSYLWSNDETTQTITGLGAGSYTVTVTDTNGCSSVQTVDLEEGNCGLLTSILLTSPNCNGEASGSATIVLTGGSEPFNYIWSSGSTDATATDLGAGDYTVTVTDVNNCSVTASATLTEPAPIVITEVSTTTTPCPGTPEGSATVVALGGTGDLSIEWANGQVEFTAVDLTAGVYQATITDANGCTAIAFANVQALDTEAPAINGGVSSVSLGSAGEITLTPQILNLNISDNCGVDFVTITPNTFDCDQLGEHTITVEAGDDAGNVASSTLTITIVDDLPPVLNCPQSIVRCFGNNVVSYDAPTASDNCLGFGGQFQFVSGLPSGSSFPVGTTTNTFSYTDAQGNVGSCSFEVTVLTQLSIVIQNVKDDNSSPDNGAINIAVNGSLSPYSFQWFLDAAPLPDTTEDISGLSAGVYTVIVTDAQGCSITSQDIPVTSFVGTDAPDWSYGLSLQPNPTSGQVAVVLPGSVVNAETRVVVFDATGRRVLERNSTREERIEMDLSGNAAGLYSVLIQIDGKSVAKKLVINR